MARRTKGRSVHGVLLVDKPAGVSSNRVLQQVKGIYQARKAGHTGALDPLATGMLPICLGEATKFAQFLLDADKTYEVTAQFGVRTNTSDADGEVVARAPVRLDRQHLADLCASFVGPQEQQPSIYSALKYQGRPLYEYARAGIEVPRKTRAISVYSWEILEVGADFARCRIHCSKGTYIRTLIDDLGQELGCGAHVAALRRTRVAGFPAGQLHAVAALQSLGEQIRELAEPTYQQLDALLLPVDTPVSGLPAWQVSADDSERFQHGQPVNPPDNDVQPLYRLYEQSTGQSGDTFLGVAEHRSDGLLWPRRVVVQGA